MATGVRRRTAPNRNCEKPRLERTACLECDLIVSVGDVREGQRSVCPRCGHLLMARATDALTCSLAFALAAAVLLFVANIFPFLEVEAGGFGKVMTLPRSALELYRDGYVTIAVLVLGPIVGAPAVLLFTIVGLLLPLRQRRRVPWLVPAGRVVFALRRWCMVEVFLIGVLVSLVKIGTMATVVLGFSFWSYALFAVCFTLTLASLDRRYVWREIEASTT